MNKKQTTPREMELTVGMPADVEGGVEGAAARRVNICKK